MSPHPRFEGKSKLGPYGDFVMQVDWTVGQVIKAVDDAGIKDNTLLIYTSDNASFMYRESDKDKPHHLSDETEQRYFEGDHTANGPWRGTKADVWEGGHRVPTFARWPKGIQAGSVSKETVCLVDLFATASELAKATLPKPDEAAPDSFSWAPLFKGKPGQFRRAPVINHSASGMFAIRMDEWKLVLGNGSGGREQPRGRRFTPPWQLFNLDEDPAETTDLAPRETERVQRMEAALFQILANDKSRK